VEWSPFPVGSFPSDLQEIKDDVWKPFPLGIPKGKSHTGVSTEREACTERSLSRYHRMVVLTIRFNNKALSTEREACTERSLSRYHRMVVLIIRFNNKALSTEREACTERSLSRYHRTAVLTIRFNNKAPMFTGLTHCGYWKQ
jgi:hypothetical protein